MGSPGSRTDISLSFYFESYQMTGEENPCWNKVFCMGKKLKKYYCLHFSTPHILLISHWKPTLTSPWKVRREQITIILDNKIPFILLHDHISFLPGTEWFGGGSRFTIQADHAAHLHLNQLFHWSLRKIWSRSWKERKKREQECII